MPTTKFMLSVKKPATFLQWMTDAGYKLIREITPDAVVAFQNGIDAKAWKRVIAAKRSAKRTAQRAAAKRAAAKRAAKLLRRMPLRTRTRPDAAASADAPLPSGGVVRLVVAD